MPRHPDSGANQPNTEFGVADFGEVETTTNEDLGGGRTPGGQSTLLRIG